MGIAHFIQDRSTMLAAPGADHSTTGGHISEA